MGPQEEKFTQLYKTFNIYNKEKEKKLNCQKSQFSDESGISFSTKRKPKLEKEKEITKGNFYYSMFYKYFLIILKIN